MPMGIHSSRPVTKYRFNMLLDLVRTEWAAAGRPASAGQPALAPPGLAPAAPVLAAVAAGVTAGVALSPAEPPA